MKDSKKKVKQDLTSFTQSAIRELERMHKFAAMHTYQCTLRSFARHLVSIGKSADDPMPMAQAFTPECLKAYQDWLLWQELSPNTLSTYLSTLRAIYNRWMPAGTRGHNPELFKGLHLKVVSRTKRALTLPQIGELMNAEPTQDCPSLTDRQQAVLAYFLLMFMLNGMPLIDLAHLRKSDYSAEDGTLSYSRHKTGKPMLVDIPPEAMPLILKYCDKTDSPYLFPILNADLRDAAQLYRCYRDVLRRFNRTLMLLAKLLLPDVKLSSYTARHTWATLAYHRGTSVGMISQALGHSSIQVTMTYLKPFKSKEIGEVNRMIIADTKNSGTKRKRSEDAVYATQIG